MKRRDFAMGVGGLGFMGALGGALGGGVALGPRVPTASPRIEVSALPAIGGPPWPTGVGKGDVSAIARAWQAASAKAVPGLGRSDALVVIQDGQLIFEGYGEGHAPDTRHVSWSMAKSITHALVGCAVLQGKVDPDRPLTTVAHPDPRLTLRSLLTLTDGLEWNEAAYSVTDSDATKMLYGPGRLDGAAWAGARRLAYPPGTHWRYSTGSFQIAAAELQALLFPEAKAPAARREAMAAWIQSSLFGPIGMGAAIPEFDAAGGFYGGSLVYASARDFARFGELYRLDGVWQGRRLLPEGWVKFARTPTLKPDYGAGFWLEAKTGTDGKPLGLMNGKGPMDAFSAEGHDGQVILVVPSKNAVVVRLGLTDDGEQGWVTLGKWLVPMLAALPDA